MIFGKRALQTRHDEVLKNYQDTTNKLGEAIDKVEQANKQVEVLANRVEILMDQVQTLTEQEVVLLDFLQEVLTFVHNAPILVRNGKPWQMKRDSLLARAKAQTWYREPQHETEQVTE